MSNPGPSTTTTTNYPLLSSNQALVLLGVLRGVNSNVTGDNVIPLLQTVGALSGTYSVSNVVVTNANNAGASISVAAMYAGVFTGPAASGTAIVSNAVFTGVTSNTVVSQRTIASTALITSTPMLYFNIGTASGVTGTVDVYVYGYNFS